MKPKLLYLIVIFTLLLSACSAAGAVQNQSAATPAAQEQAVSPSGNTQQQGQPAGARLPPKEAYDACVGKAVKDACNFTAAKGTETGTCETVQDQIACVAPHNQQAGGPAVATSAPSPTQPATVSNQSEVQNDTAPATGQPASTLTQSVTAVAPTTPKSAGEEQLSLIPAGSFEMGDHFNYVDPAHPGSDELPLHTVRLDSFYMAINDTTNQQYAEFLNSAFLQGLIEVRNGNVFGAGTNTLFFTTRQADEFSPITWDGTNFTILDNRENHPVTSVRWEGAAAYTNWLSVKNGYQGCYDLTTWKCDISKSGYRLPTEAEWEYAARGGQSNPYYNFPWGNQPDNTKANWPNSGDPYETGSYPWTTPVGFYNGELHQKSDFNWPGPQQTYQTSDGANGYGLYDMAGNVWQWVNDWYGRDYYRTSPSVNPPGPESGSPMPDGKPYHGMRGGNWYNGEWGHSRVSNRDPGYFRGPQDPNHPYYHVGFRVVLKK